MKNYLDIDCINFEYKFQRRLISLPSDEMMDVGFEIFC
jgi:hypothetical protein